LKNLVQLTISTKFAFPDILVLTASILRPALHVPPAIFIFLLMRQFHIFYPLRHYLRHVPDKLDIVQTLNAPENDLRAQQRLSIASL
jgi:hypothetical protein